MTHLPVLSRRLVTVCVVPRLAVKFSTVFRRMLAPCGVSASVAFAKVIVMIDVPVEMLRPMEPWPRSDENTALKPFRAIVTIGSAIVRWNFVITIGANRRRPDTDRNLSGRVMNAN